MRTEQREETIKRDRDRDRVREEEASARENDGVPEPRPRAIAQREHDQDRHEPSGECLADDRLGQRECYQCAWIEDDGDEHEFEREKAGTDAPKLIASLRSARRRPPRTLSAVVAWHDADSTSQRHARKKRGGRE